MTSRRTKAKGGARKRSAPQAPSRRTGTSSPRSRRAERERGLLSAAILARTEEIVEILSTRHVSPMFKLDKVAAEKALDYCRRLVDGTVPKRVNQTLPEKAFLQFLHSHGQSSDWVLCGDVGGMVCQCAAYSPAGGMPQRG